MVAVSTVDPTSTYAKILLEYPEITGVTCLDPTFNSDVHHHIITSGHPVSERPRRLSPDKLTAAKAEFRALVQAGICRPSSSLWSSPIHMVLKKDGTCRIAGDYRRVNVLTVPDTCMIVQSICPVRQFFRPWTHTGHIIKFPWHRRMSRRLRSLHRSAFSSIYI